MIPKQVTIPKIYIFQSKQHIFQLFKTKLNQTSLCKDVAGPLQRLCYSLWSISS